MVEIFEKSRYFRKIVIMAENFEKFRFWWRFSTISILKRFSENLDFVRNVRKKLNFGEIV